MIRLMILLTFLFVAGCLPESESYAAYESRKVTELNKECETKIKNLFVGAKVESKQVPSHSQWFTAHYQLTDGRVLECAASNRYNGPVTIRVMFSKKR